MTYTAEIRIYGLVITGWMDGEAIRQWILPTEVWTWLTQHMPELTQEEYAR